MNKEVLLYRSARRRQLPDPDTRKRIRESARVSQEELAAVCGVSRSTICRWETGTRTPRGQHADEYIELLWDLEGTQR